MTLYDSLILSEKWIRVLQKVRPMEIRAFAEQVLLTAELSVKLSPVSEDFTDEQPGDARRFAEPVRSSDLQFAPRRTAPKMPAANALADPQKRGVTHHILANHELQALEVMAWTLLAFPDAPLEFRRGMAAVMTDEQRHTRMHVERAAKLGVRFGELPVNCYIWKKAMDFESVMDYLAGLPLVFEGRNLDHTLELEQAFLAAGDQRSAHIMRTIHNDEIEHVAFGLQWLRKLKPDEMSDWEAFESHLHWPLRPVKAKGEVFQQQARAECGMSEEFIEQLQRATD